MCSYKHEHESPQVMGTQRQFCWQKADLVRMKVVDVIASGQIQARVSVLQRKTPKSVQFEISEGTRASVATWMKDPLMVGSESHWSGRFHERHHISTR